MSRVMPAGSEGPPGPYLSASSSTSGVLKDIIYTCWSGMGTAHGRGAGLPKRGRLLR